jgi:predicted dithiol-disulfide oxidoreductase (DUF899 family)
MAPSIPHPPVVSRDAWLVEREKLLTHEKELTKQRDRINAERRRLPMVKLEKTYVFEGPNGKRTLQDLFEGRRQLIVYHFMFDPDWTKGCPLRRLVEAEEPPRHEAQRPALTRATRCRPGAASPCRSAGIV